MVLVCLAMIANTYHSVNFKTNEFSVHSHLSMNIATNLNTLHQNWLQAVLESNSRYTCKQQSSELGDSLQGHDEAALGIHSEAVTELS
jgi:hypothetical protein